MNRTLKGKSIKNARFDVINRYNVAIASLRNQLKQAAGIDELTLIASKIIDLEQQILVEKTAGYKELEKEKNALSSKIDKIKRELRRLEDNLQTIDNKIDLKVNVYRKALQTKIDTLADEYTGIVAQMGQMQCVPVQPKMSSRSMSSLNLNDFDKS